MIGLHEPLDGYRIVCAPEMYVTDASVVERLETFAQQGGTVILTTRSGVKDAHNNALMSQLPGPFRQMTGVHAVEYAPIGWEQVPLLFHDGTELHARQWCDILETDTAETLARGWRSSPAPPETPLPGSCSTTMTSPRPSHSMHKPSSWLPLR